jgi:hypothetical protein
MLSPPPNDGRPQGSPASETPVLFITIANTEYPVSEWHELPNQPLVAIEPEVSQAIREGALSREDNGEQHAFFVSFASERPFPQGTVFTVNQENYEVISSVGKFHKAKLL